MATAGSVDVAVNFNGTVMTAHTITMNEVVKEAVLEETTPFGVAWEESDYTGVKMVADITIEGLYDDTAVSGPDAVFGAIGTSGPLVLTWKTGKTTSCTALIRSFARIAAVKAMTRYRVVLKPTGAVVEA